MISTRMNRQLLNGALTRRKNFLAGPYKGYYITIDYKPSVYVVQIHATFDNLAGKSQFESFLKEYKKSVQPLSKAEAQSHAVMLRIIEPKPKKMIPSVLNDTIEPVISHLLRYKYVTGCVYCGDNDGKIDCYEISRCHHYLCEECIRELQQDLSAFGLTIKKLNLQ